MNSDTSTNSTDCLAALIEPSPAATRFGGSQWTEEALSGLIIDDGLREQFSCELRPTTSQLEGAEWLSEIIKQDE